MPHLHLVCNGVQLSQSSCLTGRQKGCKALLVCCRALHQRELHRTERHTDTPGSLEGLLALAFKRHLQYSKGREHGVMLGWAKADGFSIVADLAPGQQLEAEPTAQDAVLGHWIWALVITKVATGLLVDRCVCRVAWLLRQRSAPSCRVHSLDLIKLCFARVSHEYIHSKSCMLPSGEILLSMWINVIVCEMCIGMHCGVLADLAPAQGAHMQTPWLPPGRACNPAAAPALAC